MNNSTDFFDVNGYLIKFVSEDVSLPSWDEIPRFSILTGANGTGKSRILSGIYDFLYEQSNIKNTFYYKKYGQADIEPNLAPNGRKQDIMVPGIVRAIMKNESLENLGLNPDQIASFESYKKKGYDKDKIKTLVNSKLSSDSPNTKMLDPISSLKNLCDPYIKAKREVIKDLM